MKSSSMTTLEQIGARLHEQALDVTHLRTALDVRMNRISHMYDDHGLPQAREGCLFPRAFHDSKGSNRERRHCELEGEMTSCQRF
jgi:hypothetical protein